MASWQDSSNRWTCWGSRARLGRSWAMSIHRGRRRSGTRARSRCGLGPTATAAPPPGVCPCREAARCAPLGVLGRAGEGEGWGQKVCVCVLVPAWMPRVHGCSIRSRGDHSHCWHALMSQRVGTGATVSDVTVDTVASGKRPWSGQLVVWEIQAPSVDQPVC